MRLDGRVIGTLCLLLVSAGFCRAAELQYVGAEKCKNCHNSPKKGDPYTKWTHERHSKAFADLASDEAKKVAAAKNIAEPQKAAECLKCHVTAYDATPAQKHKKFDQTLGVQCESCHGPGSKHVEARLKVDEPEDGSLVQIDKSEHTMEPNAETCRKCHNSESPNHKPFAFKKYFAEIAHLDPRKKRPADYIEKLPADPKDEPGADKVEFKK